MVVAVVLKLQKYDDFASLKDFLFVPLSEGIHKRPEIHKTRLISQLYLYDSGCFKAKNHVTSDCTEPETTFVAIRFPECAVPAHVTRIVEDFCISLQPILAQVSQNISICEHIRENLEIVECSNTSALLHIMGLET